MPFDASPEDVEIVTKPEVFSRAALIAWLEKQPANGTYNFDDCGGACLFGQYLAANGIPWTRNSNAYARLVGLTVARGVDVSCERPWTYGAALHRARALLSKP